MKPTDKYYIFKNDPNTKGVLFRTRGFRMYALMRSPDYSYVRFGYMGQIDNFTPSIYSPDAKSFRTLSLVIDYLFCSYQKKEEQWVADLLICITLVEDLI